MTDTIPLPHDNDEDMLHKQTLLAWFKKQGRSVQILLHSNKRRKQKSSLVDSLLRLLIGPKETRKHNNVCEEKDKAPELPVPWGQEVLKTHWSEVSYRLLGRPILEDMNRVRSFIATENLVSASPQEVFALAKWLQRFDNNVRLVVTIKDYLLEERTLIAGVGHTITILYDAYYQAMALVLRTAHDERQELSNAVLCMFDELEKIMESEVMAVKHVITQNLTEKEEYKALSSVFHQFTSDEECGVLVAHLFHWMHQNMSKEDVRVFLALFHVDVQEKITGKWMRTNSSYLHLLDTISGNYQCSLSYFT